MHAPPRGCRRTLPVLAALCAIFLAIAAFAPAAAVAQAQAPCVDVNNTTENWWPIRLRLGDGPPQQLRIDGQTFGRLCMRDTAPTTEEIHVSVRSTWMPVGECTVPPGGQVTIERQTGQDGTATTRVTCTPPRR